jgi:hypothetical protein
LSSLLTRRHANIAVASRPLTEYARAAVHNTTQHTTENTEQCR